MSMKPYLHIIDVEFLNGFDLEKQQALQISTNLSIRAFGLQIEMQSKTCSFFHLSPPVYVYSYNLAHMFYLFNKIFWREPILNKKICFIHL